MASTTGPSMATWNSKRSTCCQLLPNRARSCQCCECEEAEGREREVGGGGGRSRVETNNVIIRMYLYYLNLEILSGRRQRRFSNLYQCRDTAGLVLSPAVLCSLWLSDMLCYTASAYTCTCSPGRNITIYLADIRMTLLQDIQKLEC